MVFKNSKVKADKVKNLFKRKIVILLFLFPFLVNGAELFITPPSGVFEVQESVYVKVMLSPGLYSVNAAEGEILIPQGVVVESISTENSIFSLWTEPPKFDLNKGSIFFSGGVASPVFGNSEELFSIKLRSSSSGIKRLRIDSGAVMAADGEGTNIISGLVSSVYTFVVSPEEIDPDPEYIAPQGAPEKPVTESSTHPDEDSWYSEGKAVFSWTLPKNSIEIRAELNQRRASIPNDVRKDAVGTIEFEDIVDGVWYFHLQIRNEKGWSEISTRKIQIDSTPPEKFIVNETKRSDMTDPNIIVSPKAEDAVSGIDKFQVIVNGIYEEVFSGQSETITVGPLPPGSHSVLIRAQDKAGNSRTESLLVQIEPIEGAVFTEFSDVIHSGSIMAFRGKAIPNARIVVSLQLRGEEPELFDTRSDSDGFFTFIFPKKPSDGIYKVKAKVIDNRGAESFFGDEIVIAVQPPGVIRLGALMINSLSILIPLLAMVLLLIFFLSWGRHRWKLFRHRLNKEIREAEEEVHGTFEDLRKKRHYLLSILKEAENKRSLTEVETMIKEKIQEDIDDLGVSAEKEVHDIKRVLEK